MPLHMVVSTHNPESCPTGSPAQAEAFRTAVDALGRLASEQGARVDGMWVDGPAHTFYALIDAPSSHALAGMLMASGLSPYTRNEVHAVQPLLDVLSGLPGGAGRDA